MRSSDEIPHVSVVIPTFNRKSTIRRAIDSVLTQQNVDFELWVVDGKSTDGTVDYLHEVYGSNSRVQLVVSERGHNANVLRNIGVEKSTGKYVAFLDSDDCFLPGHLSQSVQFIEASGIEACFSGAKIITMEGERLSQARRMRQGESMFNYLVSDGFAPTPTIVLRGASAKALHWDETLHRHQDYDYLIRLKDKYNIQSTAKSGARIYWDKPLNQRQIDFKSCIKVYEKYRDNLSKINELRYLLGMLKLAKKMDDEIYKYYFKRLSINIQFLSYDQYMYINKVIGNNYGPIMSRVFFAWKLFRSGLK